MNNKHFYGGQAVIEGVMIRGKNNCVVAVRNNENSIVLNQIKLPSISKSYLKKNPFHSWIYNFSRDDDYRL